MIDNDMFSFTDFISLFFLGCIKTFFQSSIKNNNFEAGFKPFVINLKV